MSIYEIVTAVWLFASAIDDMLKKSIHLLLLTAGIIPIFLSFSSDELSLPERMSGLGTGLIVLLLAYITHEKIGKGDALLLCITGLILGGRRNCALILMAFGMIVLYSIVMLARGRFNRKSEVAFVPFMFVSYLIQIL